MASAPSDPVRDDDAEGDRVAALEAELERERRHREAAEQWAAYLEEELRTREQRLDSIIEQYERQLQEAQQRTTVNDGLWDRVTGWLRR